MQSKRSGRTGSGMQRRCRSTCKRQKRSWRGLAQHRTLRGGQCHAHRCGCNSCWRSIITGLQRVRRRGHTAAFTDAVCASPLQQTCCPEHQSEGMPACRRGIEHRCGIKCKMRIDKVGKVAPSRLQLTCLVCGRWLHEAEGCAHVKDVFTVIADMHGCHVDTSHCACVVKVTSHWSHCSPVMTDAVQSKNNQVSISVAENHKSSQSSRSCTAFAARLLRRAVALSTAASRGRCCSLGECCTTAMPLPCACDALS